MLYLTVNFIENTLLMWACIWGNYEAAEYLVQKAAAANANLLSVTNKNGDTALSLARQNGHRDIVNLLRSYGAT